ncbi:MAG: hypothetical protein KAT04_11345, partial [Methylococcales bacterium]|nr:hypothetical protein [Methylococcales bacterium]
DLGDRSEGKPFLVRFFDHLRRIVSLFNENDRKIWQKWLFRTRPWMVVGTTAWMQEVGRHRSQSREQCRRCMDSSP